MNVDRNDDILKEIPFEIDSRVNDSNGNNTCKTSNANIEYITVNGNGKSKNVDIRVEFQFKRCSTVKYCKYEKFQTFRNSNSLVHLSSCSIANNNVVIRRSKSSTGISNGSFQVCNLMENFKSSNESKTTLASISVNNEAKSLREDLSQDSSTRVDLVSLNEINLDNEIQVDEPYNDRSGSSGMGEKSLLVTPSTLCTIVLDANKKEVIREVNYIGDNIEMDIKSANAVRTTTVNGDNGIKIIEKSQSNFSMSKNTNPFLDEMDEIPNSNHKFNDTEYIENESTAVPIRIGNVFLNLEKTERSDKILLLNEVEKAISIVHTHDDDSLSLYDDDDDVCCSELLQNSNRNNFMTNPSHSHKSCTSLFPTNDLDRKTKHRTRKHNRSKEFCTSSDNIIASSDVNRRHLYSPKHETNSMNDENKKNEKLDKFITEFNRRIIADGGGAIKTIVNGNDDYRSHTIIGGIPTCPFQRQDYLKPDDDDTEIDTNNIDANPTKKSKREKKDLFGFSLHRDKCGGKIVPSIKKFNISYPNKTKNSDDISMKDADKKLFKKSLIKIGQKCGLRLNKSPEKRSFDQNERTKIGENHCDVAGSTSVSSTTQSNESHTKVAYKSYKSEIDLTRNLQYLDAFLNENFDKISQPKGSFSIGKISRRKKYGHKRTKSCSKNVEHDNEFTKFEFDVADTVDTNLLPLSLPKKKNEIPVFHGEDDLKITFPASTSTSSYYYRHNNLRLKQQTNVSSSDSFSTYNSKKSKIQTKPAKEIIYSTETPNCDKSGKSNTTSSSLSSDYASVYSPPGPSCLPFTDHRQKTSYDQQQLDLIEKQLQMNATPSSSSSSRYEKRSRNNSTDNFLNVDKTFLPPTTLPHSSNHRSIDHFEINQPDIHDKIKYQYENQLPYHEDYLKHYHQLSKSTVGSISNFPSHNPYTNYRNTSMSNGSSYGHHHYQTNATTTGTTTTVVTPTQNQNYSHRVIVSKSRKQRGEVVLEYEC